MLNIFKSEVKVTDRVKLYLTSGKEVEVNIVEIGDSFVLVKNDEGIQSRFFESLIGGWDLISSTALVSLTLESDIGSTMVVAQSNPNRDTYSTVANVGNREILVLPMSISKEQRHEVKLDPDANQDTIASSAANSLSQHIKRQNEKFSSLQDLNKLKETMLSNASKQILAANVILKKYLVNKNYGFLTDNEGRDYIFYGNDVTDKELVAALRNPNSEGVHLVASLRIRDGKARASNVYLPKSVESFQQIAQDFFEGGNHYSALAILKIIENSIENYEPSVHLKERILLENARQKPKPTGLPTLNSFIQAKHELKRGNTALGKNILIQLIETSKYENAVKELAYELQREGKIDSAIQVTIKYFDLIKSSDPNSLLAYFYETKKDYSVAITYLQKVKPQSSIDKIKLDKRLSFCFYKINDYSSSESFLRKVIAKQPKDLVSQKLLDALEQIKFNGISDEIETIFSEAELSSLTGGSSPYIQYAMANCEYAGVPAVVVSEEKFTKSTLRNLRRLIEDAGKARPKERASYLLTEAKLMEILEQEKESSLKTVLARYCLAFSQNLSSGSHPVDVVRFYLLEAFKLSSTFDTISNHIPIYINSFKLSPCKSSNQIGQTLREYFPFYKAINF